MPNFATLDENNVVTNVIVADSLEIAEGVTGLTCVPCDSTEFLGATWNGTEFVKSEPAPAE